MWILVRITENRLLERIVTYLRRLKVFFKQFPEVEYRIEVTAEQRAAARRDVSRQDLNPPNAWRSCAHCREIWDWDSLGRRPYPQTDPRRQKKAPRGKGWVESRHGGKQRVAGDCANSTMLNYISCRSHCPLYQPTNVEGLVWVCERTAEEHERRAEVLRRQAEFLTQSEQTYEELIASGKVLVYDHGRIRAVNPEDDWCETPFDRR